MKKIGLSITAMIIILAVSFTSCKKDKTAPIITLKGDAEIVVKINGTYTDAGATATDGEDGDLTSSIEITGATSVNTAKVGNYLISYKVTDEAKNEAILNRTVKVRYIVPATYTVNEAPIGGGTPTTYNQVVRLHSTIDSSLVFANFANSDKDGIAKLTYGASSVNISITNISYSNSTHNILIYQISGIAQKNNTTNEYLISAINYKIDRTPVAGGTTETTQMIQAYTRQ